MGRSRSFVETDAVRAAREVFWERGFAEAAVPEGLAEGIAPSNQVYWYWCGGCPGESTPTGQLGVNCSDVPAHLRFHMCPVCDRQTYACASASRPARHPLTESKDGAAARAWHAGHRRKSNAE